MSENRNRLGNKNGVKHGEHGTFLYKKWKSMRGRVQTHPHYLKNGIGCCQEWDSYINFKTWAEANGWSEELSLDRIDTYADYEPSNCRWVNKSIQASNISIKKNNKTGYSGVSYNTQKRKYISQIQYEGTKVYLGQYETEEEGAIAFDKFVIEHNLPHTLNFGGHYGKI